MTERERYEHRPDAGETRYPPEEGEQHGPHEPGESDPHHPLNVPIDETASLPADQDHAGVMGRTHKPRRAP